MSSLLPPIRARIPLSSRQSLLHLQVPRAFLTTTTTASPTRKPYNVTVTASGNHSIYHITKAGGNKKLTRVKGVEGDVYALRRDLQAELGCPDGEVVINPVNKHIIVKGWQREKIEGFFKKITM